MSVPYAPNRSSGLPIYSPDNNPLGTPAASRNPGSSGLNTGAGLPPGVFETNSEVEKLTDFFYDPNAFGEFSNFDVLANFDAGVNDVQSNAVRSPQETVEAGALLAGLEKLMIKAESKREERSATIRAFAACKTLGELVWVFKQVRNSGRLAPFNTRTPSLFGIIQNLRRMRPGTGPNAALDEFYCLMLSNVRPVNEWVAKRDYAKASTYLKEWSKELPRTWPVSLARVRALCMQGFFASIDEVIDKAPENMGPELVKFRALVKANFSDPSDGLGQFFPKEEICPPRLPAQNTVTSAMRKKPKEAEKDDSNETFEVRTAAPRSQGAGTVSIENVVLTKDQLHLSFMEAISRAFDAARPIQGDLEPGLKSHIIEKAATHALNNVFQGSFHPTQLANVHQGVLAAYNVPQGAFVPAYAPGPSGQMQFQQQPLLQQQLNLQQQQLLQHQQLLQQQMPLQLQPTFQQQQAWMPFSEPAPRQHMPPMVPHLQNRYSSTSGQTTGANYVSGTQTFTDSGGLQTLRPTRAPGAVQNDLSQIQFRPIDLESTYIPNIFNPDASSRIALRNSESGSKRTYDALVDNQPNPTFLDNQAVSIHAPARPGVQFRTRNQDLPIVWTETGRGKVSEPRYETNTGKPGGFPEK